MYAFCSASRGYDVLHRACRRVPRWVGFRGRRNVASLQCLANFTSVYMESISNQYMKRATSSISLRGVNSCYIGIELSTIGTDKTTLAESSEIVLRPFHNFLVLDEDDGG